MDIIRVFNGLGNQMSQYAFYLAKKRNNPLNTCWTTFPDHVTDNSHSSFLLDFVFGISRNVVKDRLLYMFFLFSKYIRYLKIIKFVTEDLSYDFNSEHLESQKRLCLTYFIGGWHSEKYFKDIRPELLEVFKFREDKLNKKSQQWKIIINSLENSCSIHIRRGDYLLDKQWLEIATADYYKSAMHLMKRDYHVTRFFVFSNDIKWCKETFGIEGIYYVDCNSATDSWQDMYLMTQCKHHINANSTFSWWGAWLCDIHGSVTIVPQKFNNLKETKDMYPVDWIKIDNLGNAVKVDIIM